MKSGIVTAVGVVGGAIASLFGGWDAALVSLMIFMASGMVLAKIIFCVVCLQAFAIGKNGMSNYVLATRARTSPAPFFRLRPGASGSR